MIALQKPVRVVFTYNEQSFAWKPSVENVQNTKDARDAFHAVVLTCQMLDPLLLEHAKVSDDFRITPAV